MPKILFVEDDLFIAEIYKKKFETSGLDALNVTTGKAVLKAVKENSFDLILLDLVIPEMSGKEVLKELRTNPEYDQDLRIVVFSNLSSNEDREECLKLGADGFISKTEFSPSEVVEEIKRFLRQFEERKRNKGIRDADSAETAQQGRGKILFIEDEEVFIEMFGRRLREEGYDVTFEKNGSAGLSAATETLFDLIISDIMMPGIDGQEIVSRLHGIEDRKDVPIFLLSASVDEDRIREIAEEPGIDRIYLKTEITPSELARAVSEFLDDRKKSADKSE
ncbi:MAG: response regulator [Candidatus Moranbacteria bacterium]|nr:response regulator [Candidatus Moranbacteria bacterium]